MVPYVALLVTLTLAGVVAAHEAGSTRADAQDIEAQALQVERQLLCPQCTNVRLDHCELAICEDMRVEIRERLAAGQTPDDILLFFSSRFGERVLADLPRSGFNLVLFGWVRGLDRVRAGGGRGDAVAAAPHGDAGPGVRRRRRSRRGRGALARRAAARLSGRRGRLMEWPV